MIYCDCGLPAVAQLSVKVGLNGCYRVVLHLCAECLSLEEEEH